jgi:hypothetical protein
VLERYDSSTTYHILIKGSKYFSSVSVSIADIRKHLTSSRLASDRIIILKAALPDGLAEFLPVRLGGGTIFR